MSGSRGNDFWIPPARDSDSSRPTARAPFSELKFVTCVSGAVLDAVVDIRTGSPSFGKGEAVRLDDRTNRCVYISEGLGHGFMTLKDDSTVIYLCSEGYAPHREYGINPLDSDLAVSWPEELAPGLSGKGAAAPTLEEAARLGLLPTFEDCNAYRRGLVKGIREERTQETGSLRPHG